MSEQRTAGNADDGTIEIRVGGSVHTAVTALCEAARDAGMTIFASIDHAAGARETGLELADEVVVLLGSPKAGTVLMQADARTGLDLPLRVLVWDDGGTTHVAWRDPRLLASEHGLAGLDAMLDKMASGLRTVIGALDHHGDGRR